MRRRIAVWIGALVVLLAPAATVEAANPQLAGLQVALRAYGLYLGPIDSIAGPKTTAAVRAFQRRSGLPVDGIVGPSTRRALGPLGVPLLGRRLILGRDSFGWDVSVLQFLLARAGAYRGAFDGYYGPQVVRAVRRFQREARLTVDGVTGPETLTALTRGTRIPLAVAHRRYRVRPGDTLSGIALRFHTTVGALARLNHLRPGGILLAGARLRVPA